MELNDPSLFFCDNAFMMTSKAPMQRLDVCVVATPNFIFTIPMKAVGMYLLVSTIKTHQFFQDATIPEGTKRLIENASNTEELEQSMTALLEENKMYIYPVAGNSSFKFRGFLGKHTLRIGIDKLRWTSIMPNKSAESKRFRAFYGQ